MGKRGRPPFGNIYTLGLDAAARAVSDRVWARKGPAKVWLLRDGGLIVRHHRDDRFTDPGDHSLVGEYGRAHATRQVRDDLSAAMARHARFTVTWPPPSIR